MNLDILHAHLRQKYRPEEWQSMSEFVGGFVITHTSPLITGRSSEAFIIPFDDSAFLIIITVLKESSIISIKRVEAKDLAIICNKVKISDKNTIIKFFVNQRLLALSSQIGSTILPYWWYEIRFSVK